MKNKKMEKGEIKSIGKSLDLLELLSDNIKKMGITEISKDLHMGISTVYRILTTLKRRGYVIQNQQTSKYTLAIKSFVLGSEVQSAMNLVNLVTLFFKNYLNTLRRALILQFWKVEKLYVLVKLKAQRC